jgi:hypothetical protein
MAKKKFEKNLKIQGSMNKINFFIGTLPFNPWAILARWLHTRNMNLQPVLNKNSTRALMELEFDVLGIAMKLLKYVVHLSKRILFFLNVFLLIWCPNNK